MAGNFGVKRPVLKRGIHMAEVVEHNPVELRVCKAVALVQAGGLGIF